ncbi:helix-turn-helix transcriptional regulator [Tautonia sociabilis]|uniref:helix-turn-helix transcriptional regulator n=1 Tax=Tautonia sociabilis TaxID=2080755 RepID=UPI0018F47C98|nr:winged helix-turn-helix domain-containing protein [Tautonia sociabilis]
MDDHDSSVGGPGDAERPPAGPSKRAWTFLSTHAQVLLCVWRQPDALIRDIAEQVGISGRAVQLVLRDLEDEGYITSVRVGRRNRYQLHSDRRLRHPLVAQLEVSTLLSLLDARSPGDLPP